MRTAGFRGGGRRGRTIYVIGDIHGDLAQLRAVHGFIEADVARAGITPHLVIHIGDLVDRREDSKGVVDTLLAGAAQGRPWLSLKGNHDRLFTMFLRDPDARDPVLRPDYGWLHPRMGGRETLASYGVIYRDDKPVEVLHGEAVAAVPQAHIDFLEALPTCFETPTHFFCHAGVNPVRSLRRQTEDDLIWIRAPFHNWTDPFEKIIVHGHTPINQVTNYGNRINVDTGAAWGDRLSAIVLDGDVVAEVTATGRREIAYKPPGNP